MSDPSSLRELLARLALVDSLEPRIRALLPEPGRSERLHRDADALGSGDLRGLFLGVKDIFRVDGLPTRAGSALPPEAFAGPEATCVSRLRAAGVLVLGKTVTTEFAYADPGATTNPHEASHTPGGSSSGSAAAVAAGYTELALGSQTVGSVNRPAAFCGVLGLKPSLGRVDRAGMLPFSNAVDCVGLFARELPILERAAAAVYEAWQPVAVPATPRLAVPDGPYLEQAEREGRAHFEAALGTLRQAGVQIERVKALADIEALTLCHRELIVREFALAHEELFARYGALYRATAAATFDRGRALSDDVVARGRESGRLLRAELERALDAVGSDLWVTPAATGPAPRGLAHTGDPSMNLPWTHAGLPALTLPWGATPAGLPLALQLVARFGADEQLLLNARTLAPLAPRPT